MDRDIAKMVKVSAEQNICGIVSDQAELGYRLVSVVPIEFAMMMSLNRDHQTLNVARMGLVFVRNDEPEVTVSQQIRPMTTEDIEKFTKDTEPVVHQYPKPNDAVQPWPPKEMVEYVRDRWNQGMTYELLAFAVLCNPPGLVAAIEAEEKGRNIYILENGIREMRRWIECNPIAVGVMRATAWSVKQSGGYGG